MVSPNVPYPLVERIEQYRAGTFRIDVLQRHGKGWRKVDEVELDPEVTDDTEKVIEHVYECTRRHAESICESGSYRALIRRKVLHEKEKRAATFDVEIWYERRKRERAARAARRSRRRVLSVHDAWMAFLETVADFNEHSLDAVEQMRRIQTRNAAIQKARMEPFLAMYEAGLQMMDETERARAEARVLQTLADKHRRSSAHRWAMLRPVVQFMLNRLGVDVTVDDTDEPSADEMPFGVPFPVPGFH